MQIADTKRSDSAAICDAVLSVCWMSARAAASAYGPPEPTTRQSILTACDQSGSDPPTRNPCAWCGLSGDRPAFPALARDTLRPLAMEPAPFYRSRNPRSTSLWKLSEALYERLRREWEDRFETERFGFWRGACRRGGRTRAKPTRTGTRFSASASNAVSPAASLR